MPLHVYKASAGSGKTYRLALSYITLALTTPRPDAFAQILAVTFTNKATGEMKDRILSYLYDLAYTDAEATFRAEICRTLGLDERTVAERAGRALTAILHDYDHFHVVTIDTFLQSLLSSLAYELDLTRGFRVNLDTDDVVSRAVDRLLLAQGRKGANPQTSRAISSFMLDKLEDGRGWNIAGEIKSFGSKGLFNDVYLRHEEELGQLTANSERFYGLVKELHARRKSLTDKITGVGNRLKEAAMQAKKDERLNGTALNSAATLGRRMAQQEDLYKEIVKVIRTAINEPESIIKKKYHNDPDLMKQAEQLSELIREAVDIYENAVPELMTVNLTLQNLWPLSLLGSIGREVTEIGRETGTFMLSRTPDLFCKMVGREDSSFVFERAGTMLRHVMIDEFQDTSQMQWEIFRRLILENMAQGDEGLIVGDIKQSIYRWRGGDWRILHNVADEMGRVGKVDVHTLDTNFRSREAILKFNNAFFPFAAQQIDLTNKPDGTTMPYTVSDIYADVAQHPRPGGAPGGYVNVELYDKNDMTDENLMDRLHERLMSLHEEQHVPWHEMLILVRKNFEGRDILEHFASVYGNEIPLTSDDSFALSASPAVMLVIGTLKWLYDPKGDTTARALCYKTMELISEATEREITATPDDLLAERERLLAMPLYALCQRVIDHYGLAAAEAAGAGQSGYLFSLLDHVLTFLDDHAPSLSDFLDYWDDTLANTSITGEIPDAVGVMTIHKAKGLQRHTVLIPFCHWDIDNDRPGSLIWCEEQDGEKAKKLILPAVPINAQASRRVRCSDYAPYYNEEHFNMRVDCLNTLYVALTRPECNLFVWARNKSSRTSSSSTPSRTIKLWFDAFISSAPGPVTPIVSYDVPFDAEAPSNEVCEEVGRRIEVGTLAPYVAKPAGQTRNPLLMPPEETERIALISEPTRVTFRQSNGAKDFLRTLDENDDAPVPAEVRGKDQAAADYLSKGRLLHYVFSLIRKREDLPAALSTATAAGLIASAEEAERIGRFIGKRLTDERAASWYDGSWTIMSETNILSLTPEGELLTRRPDRVMMRGDETVVIDYKFGRRRPEHETQVAAYMELLSRMGRPAVKGYLWYVYEGRIEKVMG